MKSVLLITTGGTIASRAGGSGLAPSIPLSELLRYLDGLTARYRITTRELLNLDSSNIQADEWILIARAVYDALNDYDGIVITHGTDTMAYTAAMLSFMLQGLRKPVVLTGSQMPIEDPLTDARNNIFTAFAAVECGIPGVSIAFDRKIIAGCRAVKVRTMGFDAFQSVNADYLGEVFADGMHPSVPVPDPAERCKPVILKDSICREVFLLKLIPGTDPSVLLMLRNMNYRGIVIEAFGAGGMQFVRTNMLDQLKALTEAGVSVVVCSQCLYDTSDLTIYEVGTRLLDCGVISAWDMTTEAVVTKLMWALGQSEDPEEIRRIFRTNYCGEISHTESM